MLTLLQEIKKASWQSPQNLEYDFINADLPKSCVYVHLINMVFPDLWGYIVLINTVLPHCYILNFQISAL